MGVEDRWQSQKYGRIKIITDVRAITLDNVISVLKEAYAVHLLNRSRIKYLIEFDRGNQPRDYTKTIRPDIDADVQDNLAAEITEFKTSYKWGNPITYKQRATFDTEENKADSDNEGIAVINEMLNEEHAFREDAELAYYVETCGIGFQMVDIKRNVKYVSVFDLKTLSPLNTFVVHDNTISHKPLMGVTYVYSENGDMHFTCVTDDRVYQILNLARIENGQLTGERDYVFGIRNGEMNPLHKVNIVEFERSYDRMGCWERQESELKNLNHLISDFTNNVEQDTQSLWWGDNLELPEKKDEEGNVTGYQIPRSGGWILTSSGEQKKASVQPLVIQIQYASILNNIRYRRDVIKQKCCVPVQASVGGGSTGTAMSMASGWDTAEIQAAKEESFVQAGKMAILELILTAVRESTDTPKDSPVLKLNYSDIQPNILRDRNYDMATKANTLATLMNCGIAPEHAIECVKLFSDVNRVINDSQPYLDLYYDAKKAAIARTQSGEGSGINVDEDGQVRQEKTGLQDTSMQASNSPITGARETKTGGRNGKNVTKKSFQ